MPNFGSGSADSGVLGIIASSIGVSVIITLVTGSYAHWVCVLLAIVVGLMACKSIH